MSTFIEVKQSVKYGLEIWVVYLNKTAHSVHLSEYGANQAARLLLRKVA